MASAAAIAAAGVAVNADAIEIDPGILLGELADGGDLIGERVVAHVAVGERREMTWSDRLCPCRRSATTIKPSSASA